MYTRIVVRLDSRRSQARVHSHYERTSMRFEVRWSLAWEKPETILWLLEVWNVPDYKYNVIVAGDAGDYKGHITSFPVT